MQTDVAILVVLPARAGEVKASPGERTRSLNWLSTVSRPETIGAVKNKLATDGTQYSSNNSWYMNWSNENLNNNNKNNNNYVRAFRAKHLHPYAWEDKTKAK